MKEYLKNMAGLHEESPVGKLKNHEKDTSSADYMRRMSGLNEEYKENRILIEDIDDVDNVYLQLLKEFGDDTEATDKIKSVFSRIVKKR
jgi:hypothetical protein